jgi:hypothetical protein
MMAIYFLHYNFVRIYQTTKVTPAMAAALVIAIGFDHAHIVARHAGADIRPDHTQEHRPIHPRPRTIMSLQGFAQISAIRKHSSEK